MRGLARALIFVLFAALAAVAGGRFGVWQVSDHLVFRSLYLRQTPTPAPDVHLIDIDYPEESRRDQPKRYRQMLGSVLRELAALAAPPRVVIIDAWISANPDGADALVDGIEALHAKGAKVYAAIDPKDRHGRYSAAFMSSHHEAIYTRSLDGYGHTRLDYAFGVLKYERDLALPMDAAELRVTALPVAAALDAQRAEALPPVLVVPLGDDAEFNPRTHRFDSATARIAPSLAASGAVTYAVLGSLTEDRDNVLRRPGPFLLAWALSDLTAGRASVAREPLNHPLALAWLSIMAALTTWSAFQLSFRMSRVRVAPLHWPLLAHVLALAAFIIALALLLAVGGAVLLAGRVIPITFPVVCAALAAVFVRIGANDWIADQTLQHRLGDADPHETRATRYDVFVSYAHDPAEHKAWVRERIVEPLSALRHADGTPYRVFFDETAIRVGRQWKREIELALLGARCFVPVYSERYFQRPYCREEIELADQLRIEGRLQILPIARDLDGVPEIYLRKLQYIDVRSNPDFAAELVVRVVEATAAS